jgi:hypothetical protein
LARQLHEFRARQTAAALAMTGELK